MFDKIVFHRVVFDPTYCCTLKCRLCCAGVPQLPSPLPYYTYEELTSDISRFFELVDAVDIFTISGGEPLLHKRIADIVGYVRAFRDRIGRLELITNGTLLPSEELLLNMKEAGGRVLLDDYGPALSIKAEEFEQMLIAHGVKYERRYQGTTEKGAHCGGWIDCTTYLEEERTEKELKRRADKCIQIHELRCNPSMDGKLYPCPNQATWTKNGKLPDEPAYYLDLRDNVTPLEEQRKRASEYIKIPYLPACKHCNGYFDDAKRYVPAEQIGDGRA